MTAIFSARPITTSIRCSTISTVLPSSRCTARISSTSSSTSSAETPAIGSSSRITSGWPASSIASSSFRLSPCESSPAGQSIRASEADALERVARPARAPPGPRRPAARSEASRRARPPRRDGRSRAPRGAGRRSRPGTSGRGRRGCAGTAASPVTSRPCSSTLPAVGRRSPESRLKSVVLPAPFGPMIPTNSPAETSSETSATIRAPPMSSPRFRVARIGAEVATIPEVRESPLALRLRRGDELALDPRDHLRLPLAVRLPSPA